MSGNSKEDRMAECCGGRDETRSFTGLVITLVSGPGCG